MKKLEKTINEYNFEQAMTRLEEISQLLNSTEISLADITNLYEEAKLLQDRCQGLISNATMRIEMIDGKKTTNKD
jgi:exodeoxyribonuclease VII small subunit